MNRNYLTICLAIASTLPVWADINHDMNEEYHDTCPHLDEVFVIGIAGKTKLKEVPASVIMVSPGTLAAHPSSNIISALARQPGINQMTTGGGISKPVIRGLGYNRVLVVNDGVRQEGQQWGAEHGVEIDGNSVNSAEIIKGPASLMYGSDAMAGVIIMNDAPTMSDGQMHAEASANYAFNDGQTGYSLNFRGNQKGYVWNWRWSQEWAHDYKAPLDGYVPNTRFRNRSLKGMLGLNRSWGYSHLILSYYHLTPGMTETDIYSGSRSYSTEIPYQEVGHYKAVLDNSIYIGDGYLKVIIGYQQNCRQEYEDHDHHDHEHHHEHHHDHDTDTAHLGLDLRLQTVNYDVRYVSPSWSGWTANFGVNGMWQKSSNLGTEYLIPAYRLFDFGVFATASKDINGFMHLSGGLRYDMRHIHSLPLIENDVWRFTDFTRSFSALSGSIGAVIDIDSHISVRMNAAHGFRAPNMSEMGSNGAHEGTFRYEIGDPRLKAEHSWQFDIGADASADIISGSVSLFANLISNYIYLTRTGEEINSVPTYRYTSGDARLFGGEATVSIHPLYWLHYHNTFSIVNAQLTQAVSGTRWLPFIPAPRWISTLHCDIPLHSNIIKNTFAEIETDVNFRQNHVMTAGGTETPTPGYSLWNFTIGTDIHLRSGRRLCTVTISGSNIFNKAFQSHLSRLKYADTYPLTGRYGYNDMGRNISVKAVFPFDF